MSLNDIKNNRNMLVVHFKISLFQTGATNGGYSSDSDMQSGRRSSASRREKKDYVYIPADCPKTTQRDTQRFLNESFRSSRATAGK